LKQENKDYEDEKYRRERKKKEKEERYRKQINQKNMRKKKIINIGKEHVLDYTNFDHDLSIESNQEVRNVFKKAELKAKMCRP